MEIHLERKKEDCWIGVYWHTQYSDSDSLYNNAECFKRQHRDIWICIIPMLPIHIIISKLVRK